MRKEQLIAIILGSLIGVIVAFSLWRLSKMESSKESSNTTNTSNVQKSNNSNTSENTNFSIVSPADNSVIGSDTAQISGFSTPGSIIAAYAEGLSYSVTNSSGEFSIDVALSAGINNVIVWSIEKGKTANKKTLLLVQTTKLDLSNPKKTATFTYGTVTDISADTLQIRTKSGQIELTSISKETTFASIVKDSKEIQFADIAIGDFIAVLGFQNDAKVMEAGRVLVTKEPVEPIYELVQGTVKTFSRNDFIVQNSANSEDVSIDATGKVEVLEFDGTDFKTVKLATTEEGSEILIFGNFKGSELIAETIILL